MDKENNDKIKEFLATHSNEGSKTINIMVFDVLGRLDREIRSVKSEVRSLESTLDNKIKLTVFEKLDIKWQSFAVMITIMLAFAAINATALWIVFGK